MENNALKDASEAITTLQNWQSMKPNEVQQVIDRLEGYITQASKPAPPQADTPIKGAGDLGEAVIDSLKAANQDYLAKPNYDAKYGWHSCIDYLQQNGYLAAQREDVSGEENNEQ
jgi:hypothetical protein